MTKNIGLPKCRPVCAASRSINQEMSEWVSQILDAASEGDTESAESCSTEDMLNQLDELNRGIVKTNTRINKNKLFVGSLDASALYPSLDTVKCAKLCGEYVRESNLEFKGIDWEWATLYVVLNTPQWKINSWRLGSVLPSRRFKQGDRPSIKGATDPMCKSRWKWPKPVEQEW